MITISFVVVINNISLKRSKRDLISQKITFSFSLRLRFSLFSQIVCFSHFLVHWALGMWQSGEREREREGNIESYNLSRGQINPNLKYFCIPWVFDGAQWLPTV